MVRCRTSLPRVVDSAASMRARIAGANISRCPMKRMRTPRRCSSSTSRSSALRNNFISAPTSSSGRPQFSLEKANSVSAWMPCSMQKSMHRFTARAPARWPMARGRRRRSAQRPLPSMMTARWRGPRAGDASEGMATVSDRHQFFFLVLHHVVDVLDRLVGQLLDLVLAAAFFVFGDLLVLQQFLDLVVRVAADVADRDLGVFAAGVHVLGELATTLFGKRGQVDADDGAGGVGRQA